MKRTRLTTSEAILCDTGPLIALLNRRDPYHASCVELLQQQRAHQLLTPIACFIEASYLLEKRIGFAALQQLWSMWDSDVLQILTPTHESLTRIRALIEEYRDVGMDFADASVVVAAEETGIRKVLTVDTHFYAYRVSDGSALEVLLGHRKTEDA